MISCLFKPIRVGVLLLLVMLSTASTPSSLEELIVEVPKISEKNQLFISAELLLQNGVSINDYCSEKKMFLLIVDRNRQPGNEFLQTVFHQHELEYHVKENCTIAQVRELCGMPENNNQNNQSTH
ncbi:MAG: hypothetical protein ACRC3B_10945 [Bacteroidia bacterium]